MIENGVYPNNLEDLDEVYSELCAGMMLSFPDKMFKGAACYPLVDPVMKYMFIQAYWRGFTAGSRYAIDYCKDKRNKEDTQ